MIDRLDVKTAVSHYVRLAHDDPVVLERAILSMHEPDLMPTPGPLVSFFNLQTWDLFNLSYQRQDGAVFMRFLHDGPAGAFLQEASRWGFEVIAICEWLAIRKTEIFVSGRFIEMPRIGTAPVMYSERLLDTFG